MRADEIQIAHPRAGISGQQAQQILVVGGHLCNQPGRQHPCIENEAQAGTVCIGLANFQRQLELGLAQDGQHGLHAQTGVPGESAEIFLQVVECHLEERIDARHAVRMQHLDQMVERNPGMPLGLPVMGGGMRQQFTEASAPVDAQLQHEGIDEATHHAGHGRHLPVGHGNTDPDAVLATVAEQQQLPGGEQQHEGRGAQLHGTFPHAGKQGGRNGVFDQPGRTGRSVCRLVARRQRERWMLRTQFVLPPRHIGRGKRLFRMRLLPDGVIDVLRRVFRGG